MAVVHTVAVRTVTPPPQLDRMPGRYRGFAWEQSAAWRGRQPHLSRWRRHKDLNALRQHVTDVLGHGVGPLPWHGVAPTDCIHGCAGGPDGAGDGCGERCTFICHEDED